MVHGQIVRSWKPRENSLPGNPRFCSLTWTITELLDGLSQFRALLMATDTRHDRTRGNPEGASVCRTEALQPEPAALNDPYAVFPVLGLRRKGLLAAVPKPKTLERSSVRRQPYGWRRERDVIRRHKAHNGPCHSAESASRMVSG